MTEQLALEAAIARKQATCLTLGVSSNQEVGQEFWFVSRIVAGAFAMSKNSSIRESISGPEKPLTGALDYVQFRIHTGVAQSVIEDVTLTQGNREVPAAVCDQERRIVFRHVGDRISLCRDSRVLLDWAADPAYERRRCRVRPVRPAGERVSQPSERKAESRRASVEGTRR